MELKRTVETVIATGSLLDLVNQAQFGDIITLVEDCQGLDDWRPHPEGVATRKGRSISLNREQQILELPFKPKAWAVSSKGEIFAQHRGNIFHVDPIMSQVASEIDKDDENACWALCEAGVIVQNTFGGPLLHNGHKEIHPGGKFEWAPYYYGFVSAEYKRHRKQFRFNGKKVICQGEYDSWGVNPKGIIIRRGNDLLLNGKAFIHRIQHEESPWGGHFYGVAVEDNGKINLVIT